MSNLRINGKLTAINAANLTILQLFEINKIEIPRFCYHEKLSVAGNCRMCLVEIEGVKKPIASCAMPIASNMSIFSSTTFVKKAREGILEFLLANHPLDCPICDQGGECDLQEHSLLFGSDKGRFYEKKRVVLNKNCGPFIKMIMTRCIHCTRCVRYSTEIAGVNYLGVVGRGQNMEISGYLEKIFFSEVSGNVIDLCPVGALTSKPYAFVARPWELFTVNSFDFLDVMCPDIRVDLRDRQVVRILPRHNNYLDDCWISDKSRFSYDGYFVNRLNTPLLYSANQTIFQKLNWKEVFSFICAKFVNFKARIQLIFLLGDFVDLESSIFLKKALNKHGNAHVLLEKHNFNLLNLDFRYFYFHSLNLENLKQYSSLFFVNLNLRYDLPLLNIKVKSLVNKIAIKVFCIGENVNYNYLTYYLGKNINTYAELFLGKLNLFKVWKKNERVLILSNLRVHNFFAHFLITHKFFFTFDPHFFFVDNSLTSIPICENNLINKISFFKDFSTKFTSLIAKRCLYGVNVNKINFLFKNKKYFENMFSIYQGHHLSAFAYLCDAILPVKFIIEKNVSFFDIFLNIKQMNFLINGPKLARNDLELYFYFFREVLFKEFKGQAFLTNVSIFAYIRNHIKYYTPIMQKISNLNLLSLTNKNIYEVRHLSMFTIINLNLSFVSTIVNFFCTNQITSISPNMVAIVRNQKLYYSNFF